MGIAKMFEDLGSLERGRGDMIDQAGASMALDSILPDSVTLSVRALQRERAALADPNFMSGILGRVCRCGKQISEARLRAKPFTAVCIDCAEKGHS